MKRAALLVLLFLSPLAAQPGKTPLQPMDIFRIQHADDPQLSPDGKRIVYVRVSHDVQKDKRRSNLWIVYTEGQTAHEALTTGSHSDSSPRWSPDGKRLLYVSDVDGKPQLYVRWLDSGRTARLTDLPAPPLSPAWSPDGNSIAFASFVAEPVKPFVELPPKPEGAEWAPPFKATDKLIYRFDGRGYLKEGHIQTFVIAADGGAVRQLTSGAFDQPAATFAPERLSWSPDGKSLVFAANRHPDGEFNPLDTEVYELTVADRSLKPLTDRRGPDSSPVVSPDGKHIAYIGFDDRQQGHQTTRLYVMDRDGKNSRVLTEKLDRSVASPAWIDDSDTVLFQYDDQGTTRVGQVRLTDPTVVPLVKDVGGTSLGRPYASGSFTAVRGRVAFTLTRPTHPAEVAVFSAGQMRRLTNLNDTLFADRTLSEAEEIRYPSSHDRREIQGWILKPPGFDEKKKYPLILEIHGGPFANYGDRFGLELQLLAAAGYVVLYVNPRGSTGYGEEFGNLIHHAYPGRDADDLLSGVDAVLKRGYVDEKNLFVTGGSGGGVLTCWLVGKTKRFRAAVSTFPVVNWESWLLTADATPFFVRNWFPGPPWENAEHYRARSPLSLVGNVVTPTMLITGEEDFRTPIPETEQFYKALKLRKIDTMMVRVPGASHNVSARPSHLIAKTAYILKWFEKYREGG
jgi:acylaminoacyl-peptidase